MNLTKEDRIKTVYNGGRHVVILGAGASIASTMRNREIGGKILPSMDNFIDIVGLQDIVDKIPSNLKSTNFETLYSNLHNIDPNSVNLKEIESRIQEYFGNMKLPNEPTIYDYLVLSLRSKDLIATFNWDPFLYQAYVRNYNLGNLPGIVFLHGNVAIGYSTKDGRMGAAGYTHTQTNSYYEPTKLLYPVEHKDYNTDEFISTQWSIIKELLNSPSTKRLTIFGYSAPASDIEAVELLNEAWGSGDKRNMEQIEIIDIRPETIITENWRGFIHSHHYDYVNDYFKSSLALNPRRTCESYFQHFMPMLPSEMFSENNPVTSNFKTLKELQEWHKDLIDAELFHEKNEESE